MKKNLYVHFPYFLIQKFYVCFTELEYEYKFLRKWCSGAQSEITKITMSNYRLPLGNEERRKQNMFEMNPKTLALLWLQHRKGVLKNLS